MVDATGWFALVLKRSAIEGLYRTHGAAVLRRARRLLGNDADANEVLQDVFASLLQRPQQFAGRSSVMTFLYRVTTNRCLNRIRDSRNQLRLLQAACDNRETGRAAEQPDLRSEVRSLLLALPDDLARTAIYYYLDEMSQAEVAEMLGCSRRHVGNLLTRLRDCIDGQTRRDEAHA